MLKRLFNSLEPYLFPVCARVRPLIVLHVIRWLGQGRVGRSFRRIWDPDVIRKNISFEFKQHLVTKRTDFGNMIVDINDHIGFHFFLNDRFDDTVEKVAEKLRLGEEDIFLDIGANIGTTSIPVAQQTNCSVIAIEGSKSNGALLLQNAFINEIKLHPIIALMVDEETHSKDRWLTLSVNSGNTGSNSLFSEWNPSLRPSRIENAPTSTIDKTLDEETCRGIGLIKIDVEGAESLVFRGGQKLLHANAPILFEYRNDAINKYLNKKGNELVDILHPHFKIFALDEHLSLQPFDRNKSYENALAIPYAKLDETTALLAI